MLHFESLTGSAFADILSGSSGRNILHGGAGGDTLVGGLGDDTLYGDAGYDTVSYAGAASAVSVSLAIATAQDTGAWGDYTLVSIEALVGSAFNDHLTGGSGNDTLPVVLATTCSMAEPGSMLRRIRMPRRA